MKIVVLNQSCEIGGIERAQGEVVKVTDDFDSKKIKKVIQIIKDVTVKPIVKEIDAGNQIK